jgi:hypothetical protein
MVSVVILAIGCARAAAQPGRPPVDLTAGFAWAAEPYVRSACASGYLVFGVATGVRQRWILDTRLDRLVVAAIDDGCRGAPLDGTSELRHRLSVHAGRRIGTGFLQFEPVVSAGA